MATLTEFGTDNGFTSGDLNIDGYFAVVNTQQMLFIADGRPSTADINTSGYHRIDCANTKITGSVTGSLAVGDSVVQDTTAAAGVIMEIIDATHLLIYRTTVVEFEQWEHIHKDGDNYIVPSVIQAPPHWLLWSMVEGDFPDGGSNVMALFEGRIFMNSMYHPNQWFATRQDGPYDLDSTVEDDVQAAIASQSSEIGGVGDVLVALIPYKDNYLLFCLANSIYILRGGSTGSGALSYFTQETGVFSPESFCWDNDGNLYIVGLTGFFKIPNGMATGGVDLDNISMRKLPNLFNLLQLNRKTDRVVMGFDKTTNTIEVVISTQDGSWSVCFCYDIINDAIIPDSFAGTNIPSCFTYVNSYQDDVSGLLIGCYDGYVRKFDPVAKSDDGEIIGSQVLFGPITINQLVRANVKIKEIQINLSDAADGLEWRLYQAKSNEELVKGINDGSLTPIHTGTFSGGGRQAIINEKIAGESIGILFLNSTLDSSWGLEGIKLRYTLSGKEKEV